MQSPTLEVDLTTFTYGGDALGRSDDGRAVFVPYGIAGERVLIEVVEQRERYLRGRLVEVLQAAPQRVDPRCKHFGACGGCHYQHMSYEAQLAAKTQILRGQITRIGRIPDPPVAPAVGSRNAWNYRNQIQFHVSSGGKLGFVHAASASESRKILAIDECHLPEAGIRDFWPQLTLDQDTGIERVAIRTGAEDELMVVLYSDSEFVPELSVEAAVSIAHVCADETLIQVGADHVTLKVRGRDFRVSPTSFFQANRDLLELMILHVLDRLPASAETIIDAYCGVGLFSAFLAPRCRRLIAIEASRAASEDFSVNLDEFENVELYEDVVERALPALDAGADAVLVDPPRAGLERAVVDGLISMAPGTIVYVSCDPATLARDAGRLVTGGYQLAEVTPFDMFPQTYHIESVSVFRR